MQSFLQDLRYGARMLLKRPGFTLIAAITLALGIGANTAMFSLLDALLLKPLPGVAEPDRLVQIGRTYNGVGFNTSAYADYRDFRDQNTTFTGIAAESDEAFHLGTDKTAERVWGVLVSGNYFEVLGAHAAQGRLLQPDDARNEGESPVAVISERLWRKHFGDESPVGKAISLNSHNYTIVGVAADFKGTGRLDEKRDVWIPVTMWRHGNPWRVRAGADWLNSRNAQFVELFGRLKPGVTVAQAQTDLGAIAERLERDHPRTNAINKVGVKVLPGLGLSPDARKNVEQFVGIQIGVVAVVLLIACANVAGLLLARGASEQKEIGVRMALGAPRWRVVQQLLTESATLALLGAVLGILVALWLSDWVAAMLPESQNDLKAQLRFTLDWRALSFTLGLSLLTGILFGLAPALQLSKPDLIPALKDARGSLRGGRSRLRSSLVVGQVALSLLLLVSAGLFLRTLRNAQAINVGFSYENLLTARLDLDRQGYTEEQGRGFYQQRSNALAISRVCDQRASPSACRCKVVVMATPLRSTTGGRSICAITSSRRATMRQWVSHCCSDALSPNRITRARRQSPSSTKPLRGAPGRTRIRSANISNLENARKRRRSKSSASPATRKTNICFKIHRLLVICRSHSDTTVE